MDVEEVNYSLDEDFGELTDKDKTVELVGYVCFDLFKFPYGVTSQDRVLNTQANLKMDVEEVNYSLDEDFGELTDKDKTVELVGYVCFVEAPTKVKGYDLFKFGLTNG
ncbi:hypothetical protein TSAR_008191 [Trichomalopsis sarcophagae]|uniref:Uncharacterized protein n=1 Tax=Trichomalopsis sarcophagae TaxID=543379 RepID=A0A232EJ52_9HYME|nr:hypothetical protein TSAR_008191 [Trichomalopsis sarcophagae]